jgi:uncharacterized protein (TIRG00374 family)
VIGVGLVVSLAVSGAINWSVLLEMIAVWPIALASLSLLFCSAGLTSWRLCILLKPCGFYLSPGASLQLTLIGTFFNAYLPGATGGDAVRIYYAVGDNRGRRTEVATIMLLDRAIGMLALLVWPLLVVLVLPHELATIKILHGLLWIAAGLAAVLVVSMLICSAGCVQESRLASWAFQTLPLGSYVQRTLGTLRTYRHSPEVLLAAVGISLVVQSLVVGAALLFAWIANAAGSIWLMSMLIALGFMANALPLTPGGLGVGEVAFTQLFVLAGLTGGAETLLGWRILTMPIGLLGLVFYLRGCGRFIYESPSLIPGSVIISSPNRIG